LGWATVIDLGDITKSRYVELLPVVSHFAIPASLAEMLLELIL